MSYEEKNHLVVWEPNLGLLHCKASVPSITSQPLWKLLRIQLLPILSLGIQSSMKFIFSLNNRSEGKESLTTRAQISILRRNEFQRFSSFINHQRELSSFLIQNDESVALVSKIFASYLWLYSNFNKSVKNYFRNYMNYYTL